jgi:hypothetical protein
MNDIQKMHGTFETPEVSDGLEEQFTVLNGVAQCLRCKATLKK